MAVLLRNRLKYALTYDECKKIVMQRLIKVDGKVRTDKTYPCGFMGKQPLYRYDQYTNKAKKKCLFPIPWQKKFESVGRIEILFYFEILFFRGPVVTPDDEVNA